MAVINTNIMSLNAQRHLASSQSSLQIALERLSSGMRINSSKDDAAGLAIATRMTTQINGLNQAVRNANDAISLSQTADGALTELTNNLQRIRELAVEAANATNSASDRTALDQEVQQRLSEVNRIASQTSFNGQKILDGTFGTAKFQIGANVNENISVTMSTSLKTSDIGAYVNSAGTNTTGNDLTAVAGTNGTATVMSNANFTSGAGSATYAASPTGVYGGVSSTAFDGTNFSLNGTNVAASADYKGSAAPTYQDASSAYAKAAAINASGVANVTASADTTLNFATSGGTAGTSDFLDLSNSGGAGTVSGSYTLNINGQDVLTYSASGAAATSAQGVSLADAVSNINQYSSTTGVVATKDSNGNLQLTASDGRNIEIKETIAGVDGTTAATMKSVFGQLVETTAGTAASVTQDQTFRGQITLQSSTGSGITLGGTQTAAGYASTTTLLAAGGNVGAQNVTTLDNANATILSVDAALTQVNALRSTFGAIQNRFESTIASLSATSENLTAARSRIQDADFAAETAALTRAQILQQAGTAMLAQANAVPNTVLTLLR